MLFNSVSFLIFFPIVVLVYYCLPEKLRKFWLLAASYYFYMSWNAKYAILIFISTVITFAGGLLLEKVRNSVAGEKRNQRLKKAITAFCVISNLGILFYFKYAGFAAETAMRVLERMSVHVEFPVIDPILPVGISFYTFQALSYTIDVYRGRTETEHSFIRYALFVSFFPQLVAGPIERSGNLLKQLAKPLPFQYERARDGILLMLWGFFLKIVLADRAAIFVDTVYGDPGSYPGFYLITATMLFAVQIYCDFCGYSIIARGAAKILGITLMENFDAPYLSATVADFWRHWHISLTSWFKDYVYIPLGGSRKGTIRKYINKMIVFLLSGLWHGASFTFIVWGGLNGIYQVAGEALMPLRDRLVTLLGLNRETFSHKLAKTIFTFILVDFSWIFFRAGSITQAMEIIHSILHVKNPWILIDGSLFYCGLDDKNFRILLISIIILFFADFCKRRKIVIRDVLIRQEYWFRWLFIAVSVVFILTFGIWGSGYNENSFIYFQF